MAQRHAQCAWGVNNFIAALGDYGYSFPTAVKLTVNMDGRHNLSWGISTIANPGGLVTEVAVKVFAVYARAAGGTFRQQIGVTAVFNLTGAVVDHYVDVPIATNCVEAEVEFTSATVANATLVAFTTFCVGNT